MDKSREQFEEWFKKEFFDAGMAKYGEKLVDFVKKEQFKIWQASRESLEIELPEHPDKSDPFYDNFDLGISLGIDQVKKVLIANGVKVK